MSYKGFEIRPGCVVKLPHNLEVKGWGIYRNGDYRGMCQDKELACRYVDELLRRENKNEHQKTA